VSTLASLRIAVGGFMHETNTFQPQLTTYEDFAEAADRPPLVRGPDVLTRFEGINTSIAGALSVLCDTGATLLPLPWASTTPAGYVTRDTFERITAMILEDLKEALPLDGIYLSLHGAMVAEHVEDAEGELLARIRAVVGSDLPIVASLDLHSNTTPLMFAATDGLVGYCTYPHVDMAEAGNKAARLLLQILHRGRKPHKAYLQQPYLIPLTWQCTTIEPSKSIYIEAATLVDDVVVSASFTPGFPAADIYDCGPAVFAYGWNEAAVDHVVARMHSLVLEAEPRYAGRLWAPRDAVNEAMRRTITDPRPVLLADTQDNPGVGGSSDTIGLLAALLDCHVERAVLGVIHDADAAMAAHNAGVGSTIAIGLGAKSRAWGEQPLVRPWRVERLGDGNMVCQGPMLKGWPLALGPTVKLSHDGVSVVVTTRKFQPMDEEPFRHVGIDCREQRIVALKSSVHFRAAFEGMAQDVFVVESPGAMIVDPASLPFTRLRPGIRMRPLGPTFPRA